MRNKKPENEEDLLDLIVTAAAVVDRVERVKSKFRPTPWKKGIRKLEKNVNQYKYRVEHDIEGKSTFRIMLNRIALHFEWKKDIKELSERQDRLKRIIESRRDDKPYVPTVKERVKRGADSIRSWVTNPAMNAWNMSRKWHFSTHLMRYRLARPLGLEYKTVRELLGHIVHGDEAVSCDARRAMEKIIESKNGAKAIPSLVRALADTDNGIRYRAIETIGRLGEKALPALPALIRVLDNDPAPDVRVEAAHAIGVIGPKAKDAWPALEKMLLTRGAERSEAELRYISAVALVWTGWHEGRSHDDAMLQRLAETLNAALADKVMYSKGSFCEAIGMLGKSGAIAIPGLVKMVEAQNYDSPAAFEALLKMGSPAVKDLLYLGLRYHDLNEKAKEAIVKMGVDAVPAVIGAMSNSDMRPTCTTILTRVGEPAVPILIKVLKGGDVNARCNAVMALGEFGEKAEAAIPPLVGALTDISGDVRGTAQQALARIGEPAIPALIEAANSGNPELRRKVFHTFITMAEKGASATPFLIEALRDEDADVRLSAAVAVSYMGGKAVDALPALHALAAKDPEVRETMRKVIDRISSKVERPSGVREVSERPKDITIERMFRGMASDLRPRVRVPS